jgi:hypothetical protein
MMSGKIANATPFINELQEGLYGNSSKKDLETMFQLIYLRFTQPRADKNAFDVLLNQYRTQLANQSGAGIQFLQRIGGCADTRTIRDVSATPEMLTSGIWKRRWLFTRTALLMRAISLSCLSAALTFRQSSL